MRVMTSGYMGNTSMGKVVHLCRVKTVITAVLSVMSGLDPHMSNYLKMIINHLWLVSVALLSSNHKSTHPCYNLDQKKKVISF